MISQNNISLKDWMTDTLTGRFSPSSLTVIDESHRHEGHGGWREGGETHYRIEIVSAAFEGTGRVDRHRMINEALADAFKSSLHALSIQAKAPSEI